MKPTPKFQLPAQLPTSHADLLKLREELKVRARELRKANDKRAAAELTAFGRKVRRAERAARKAAPKSAKPSAAKAKPSKKAPTKEGAPLRKAA
jgi:hypothetical protein